MSTPELIIDDGNSNINDELYLNGMLTTSVNISRTAKYVAITDCPTLTTIKIQEPEGVTLSLSNCPNVVDIPSGVKYLRLNNCPNVVDIPSGVKDLTLDSSSAQILSSINPRSDYCCFSLKLNDFKQLPPIPNRVVLYVNNYLGDEIHIHCNVLYGLQVNSKQPVILSKDITSFAGIMEEEGIEYLRLESTTPPWTSSNNWDYRGIIYVPKEAVETYKSDSNWQFFADQIVGY